MNRKVGNGIMQMTYVALNARMVIYEKTPYYVTVMAGGIPRTGVYYFEGRRSPLSEKIKDGLVKLIDVTTSDVLVIPASAIEAILRY